MNNKSSELPSMTEKLPLPSSSLPLIQDSKTLTLFLLRKKKKKARRHLPCFYTAVTKSSSL